MACNSQQDLQDWLDLLTKHTHTSATHRHSHRTQSVCHTVSLFFKSINQLVSGSSSSLHLTPLSLSSLIIPLFLPVALPPRHSFQTLRVSCREQWTHLPHPPPSFIFWDSPQQQPHVGAPGATEYAQTLEPELPSPSASTAALCCPQQQGGTVHLHAKNRIKIILIFMVYFMLC